MDVKKQSENVFGFSDFNHWHCQFPVEKIKPEHKKREKIILSEPRIDVLAQRVNIENMRVLELGCLEGMHSLMMHELGASQVVSIEGRKDNYQKCLVVKNAFELERCTFIKADVQEIIHSFSDPFDLCLAVGILYHLPDPVSVIRRIAELCPRIFIWTHYATLEFPKGQTKELSVSGHTYKGKLVGENTKEYLSGLQKQSFWMLEQDLMDALHDAGFKNIEVINKENHEHGPAITLLGEK